MIAIPEDLIKKNEYPYTPGVPEGVRLLFEAPVREDSIDNFSMPDSSIPHDHAMWITVGEQFSEETHPSWMRKALVCMDEDGAEYVYVPVAAILHEEEITAFADLVEGSKEKPSSVGVWNSNHLYVDIDIVTWAFDDKAEELKRIKNAFLWMADAVSDDEEDDLLL